jgi:hypothetical protein
VILDVSRRSVNIPGGKRYDATQGGCLLERLRRVRRSEHLTRGLQSVSGTIQARAVEDLRHATTTIDERSRA